MSDLRPVTGAKASLDGAVPNVRAGSGNQWFATLESRDGEVLMISDAMSSYDTAMAAAKKAAR